MTSCSKNTEEKIMKMIKNLQDTYGNYNEAQRKVVFIWLSKTSCPVEKLYAEVLSSVSWQFKSPPGPKEFNDALKSINKANMEMDRPELQEYKYPQIEEDLVPKGTDIDLKGMFNEIIKKKKGV